MIEVCVCLYVCMCKCAMYCAVHVRVSVNYQLVWRDIADLDQATFLVSSS